MNLNKNIKFESANHLENKLQNPFEGNHLFSFQSLLDLDEEAKFPVEQVNYLNSLELNKNILSPRMGGILSSFAELGYLYRALFRRDIGLGVAYGSTTLMAGVHIYIAGSQHLNQRYGEFVSKGHSIAIGYHELEHGNDLLNNETFAVAGSDGYSISGSKWLINNAVSSKAVTTFVRTHEKGGPKGYSLFFIEKDQLAPNTYSYVNRINTVGVRGCQLAGIHFKNAQISKENLIGNKGDGFELTAKAFQITRSVLPSMAMGSGDAALRIALNFAKARHLYGNPISHIAHVKETLVNCLINLLVADCISLTATRGLHFIPEQMSVIASIAKFSIPKLLSSNLKELSILMGSRFYMREGEFGIFQKIVRDFPIVSLGHSSDVICLHTILPQLKFLLTRNDLSSQAKSKLGSLFALDNPLPIFQSEKLRISNYGCNDIVNMIFHIKELIYSIPANNIHPSLLSILEQGINYCHKQFISLQNECAANVYQLKDFSCHAYNMGESYCKIFIFMSNLLMWKYNCNKLSSFFDSGIWLALSLKNLFPSEKFISEQLKKGFIESSYQYLDYLHINQFSYSLVPIQYT